MSRPVQQLDCVGAGVSCSFSGTTGTITVSGGSGTVTSITQGTGMSFSVTPITATGTINLATPVSLANGGTNAALTADTGAIAYSSATAISFLASTATANKLLLSGSSSAPVWSTPTVPNSSPASGRYLKGDGTNWGVSTGSASGTGACATSNWASTLTSDAAPTCTQPGIADLSSSTSASLATVLSDETGTAGKAVFDTSPTFQTGITVSAAAPRIDFNPTSNDQYELNANGSMFFLTDKTTGTVALQFIQDRLFLPQLTTVGSLHISAANGMVVSTAVPSCVDTGGNHLNYNSTTQTYSCGTTSSGSGNPGGSNTQVQYNNNGVFGGITNFTSDGTNITAATFNPGVTISGSAPRLDFNPTSGDQYELNANGSMLFLTDKTNGNLMVRWLNSDLYLPQQSTIGALAIGNSSGWVTTAGSATNAVLSSVNATSIPTFSSTPTISQLLLSASVPRVDFNATSGDQYEESVNGSQYTLTDKTTGNPLFRVDPTQASVFTGALNVGVGGTTTGQLVLKNSMNGNNTILQAGAATKSTTWTLPTSDGSANQGLLTNGAGVLSWGASVLIPSGASPTVDAAGKIVIDTTDDQLVYYGAAARVLPYEQTHCVNIENLKDTDDNMPIVLFNDATTVTAVGCTYVGTGTTVATFTLQNGTGSNMTITGTNPTCVAHGSTATFASVTANNSVAAGTIIRFSTTNTPAPTSDTYTLCVTTTTNAQ